MKNKIERKIVKYRRDAELYFRVGTKYVDRRCFSSALKFISTAVEMEPFNADYKFNLACVLAELKDTKKSNTILKDILKNIDPTLSECYFGIGCNYFDMGSLKKAKEYFEKIEGAKIPTFKVNIRVHKLLQEFILKGGYDIEIPEE